MVFLDNPAVPEASASGLLATARHRRYRTPGDADANLAGPGTVDGKTYGVPIGANTLGLYYNEDILKKAGVDPATITDWASLNAALEKVTKAGDKGITFAGVPGEEGTFQFLPWFWGAGANLKDIGSAQAVQAGQLVSDWVAKGYAPKSAITDNQSASWDQFLTGDVRLRRERLVVRQGRGRGEVPDQDDAHSRRHPAAPPRFPRVASSGSCRCTRTTVRATTPPRRR